MNDRIDDRKVSKYLYEIAGCAGEICFVEDFEGDPNKLARGPKEREEPEYVEAQRLYLTLSETELEARLAHTQENMIHPCGTPLQWDTYCRIDERAYKQEYLRSDEWKRKKDAVMNRAQMRANRDMPPKIPANAMIRRTVDRYGREIKSIETEDYPPLCENEGCTNEAKHIHHLTYERLGKERLEDLQALCPECHRGKH